MNPIYQADLALRQLRPVLVRDEHAEEIARHTCRFGEGITGWAADRMEPVLANDLESDPRAVYIPGTSDDPEALMTVPLVARGELKGMLNVYRHGPGKHFSADEFELAKRFAELAALAVDNAQIRERLEAQIVTDPGTGLYNHRYFQERLADEMRESARSGLPVSVALIDVDDFKRVNEGHGLLVGDRVLAALATLLREEARPEDVVCRVGGEEFAVILRGTGVADTVTRCERLRQRVAATSMGGDGISLTVTIGIAEGPTHARPGPKVPIAEGPGALVAGNVAIVDSLPMRGPGGDRDAPGALGEA